MTTQRVTGKNRASDPASSLPYAVDATASLSPEELGVLQEQYVQEQDKGYISTQTKFNLAW